MSVTRNSARAAGRQSGFTLVEVLVALIVLAIGLLGLAQLQARGLKFNQDAYVRSQATTLAYEIIDRMRSNRASVDLYTAGDPGGTCTPSTSSVTMDLNCWYDHIRSTLPAGTGAIAAQAALPSGAPSPYYDITITWNDRETGLPKTQRWTTWP